MKRPSDPKCEADPGASGHGAPDYMSPEHGSVPARSAELNDRVVALYVDPRGPYPSLVKEWYDEARDARTYTGGLPVVAHPPCGPWGPMRHLCTHQDAAHAVGALFTVRKNGGVLEHPKGSTLWDQRIWAFVRLPLPGELPDRYGGITIEVNQCDWGHVARKPTWLYIVGARELPPFPPPRKPTHWIGGGRTKSSRKGSPIPPGIKACSAQQRRRTPRAFAEWLIAIAEQCRRAP